MDSKQSTVSDRSGQEQHRAATDRRADMRHDFEHSDSDEIREGIDVTRHRMDETLDELGERLSPRHLLDDAWEMLRGDRGRQATRQVGDSISEFGQNLGRQVRDNPVPSLLIGAGIAWMAFGGGQRSHEGDEYQDDERLSSAQRWRTRGAHQDPDYWTDDDLLLDVGDEPGMPSGRATRSGSGGIVIPETYQSDVETDGKHPGWKDAAAGKAAAAGRSISSAASGAKDSASNAAHKVGEKASDAASATSSALGAAKDSVTHAASSAGSSVAGAAGQIGRGAHSASRGAYQRTRAAGRGMSRSGHSAGRYVSRKTRSSGEHIVDAYDAGCARFTEAKDEHPLAVGLGFLALGMLAGLVAPRTRYEDEWMGEASDEMADRLAETGEELVEHSKEVVSQTVETAKHSAKEHGLTGDNLAERVGHVVEKSAAAVKQAAKEESLSPSAVAEEAKQVAGDVKKTAEESFGKAAADVKREAESIDPHAGKAADRAADKAANRSTG